MPAAAPSIKIGLVIVTAPKPAGSRTLISPRGAVLEMAPANVLQGAVLLQGFASSPTPDTQVRVACAKAEGAAIAPATATSDAANSGVPRRWIRLRWIRMVASFASVDRLTECKTESICAGKYLPLPQTVKVAVHTAASPISLLKHLALLQRSCVETIRRYACPGDEALRWSLTVNTHCR